MERRDFLKLAGLSCGAWLHARAAARAASRLATTPSDGDFLRAKLQSAQFYADQVLPQAGAFARVVQRGARSVLDSEPALL